MEDKTKDQGIIGDRKSEPDDAAEINESGGVKGCACCGEECHIEWTDD